MEENNKNNIKSLVECRYTLSSHLLARLSRYLTMKQTTSGKTRTMNNIAKRQNDPSPKPANEGKENFPAKQEKTPLDDASPLGRCPRVCTVTMSPCISCGTLGLPSCSLKIFGLVEIWRISRLGDRLMQVGATVHKAKIMPGVWGQG